MKTMTKKIFLQEEDIDFIEEKREYPFLDHYRMQLSVATSEDEIIFWEMRIAAELGYL